MDCWLWMLQWHNPSLQCIRQHGALCNHWSWPSGASTLSALLGQATAAACWLQAAPLLQIITPETLKAPRADKSVLAQGCGGGHCCAGGAPAAAGGCGAVGGAAAGCWRRRLAHRGLPADGCVQTDEAVLVETFSRLSCGLLYRGAQECIGTTTPTTSCSETAGQSSTMYMQCVSIAVCMQFQLCGILQGTRATRTMSLCIWSAPPRALRRCCTLLPSASRRAAAPPQSTRRQVSPAPSAAAASAASPAPGSPPARQVQDVLIVQQGLHGPIQVPPAQALGKYSAKHANTVVKQMQERGSHGGMSTTHRYRTVQLQKRTISQPVGRKTL